MSENFITFEGVDYPKFQTKGKASHFAIPSASHFCRGLGYDIGCKKEEWALPGAIPIDLSFDNEYEAMNLPHKNVDYIFSSHCLEHIDNWIEVMEYWYSILKPDGVLFLYLPDYSQKYWRPWNNKKHKIILSSEIMQDFMKHLGYKNIFASGVDLNNSFMIVGEK